jgi:hypothetical protein
MGAVTLPYAQKLAIVGLVGLAAGAAVSQKKYEWAAPGAILGGVLALGLGYAVLQKA